MHYKLYISILCLLSFSTLVSFGQQPGRFKAQINYGINGNYYANTYEYNSEYNYLDIFDKKFVGTTGGVEVSYALTNNASIFTGYSKTTNTGTKNLRMDVGNVQFYLSDFKLRHINHFVTVGYERRFKASQPAFTYHLGATLVFQQQQEISLGNLYYGPPVSPYISVSERSGRKSGLNKAGLFAGFEYRRPIDKRFDLGLKVRGYYMLTNSSFETITLTPTLTYKF
jgi:hypothetical protein